MQHYITSIFRRRLKMNTEVGWAVTSCTFLSFCTFVYVILCSAYVVLIGFNSCECRKDFRDYADVCFREFGDRVKYWNTVNEPNVFAIGAYDQGALPPRRCSQPFGNCTRGDSTTEPYLVVHHILLAHSSAVRLYRRKYKVWHQIFHNKTLYFLFFFQNIF